MVVFTKFWLVIHELSRIALTDLKIVAKLTVKSRKFESNLFEYLDKEENWKSGKEGQGGQGEFP